LATVFAHWISTARSSSASPVSTATSTAPPDGVPPQDLGVPDGDVVLEVLLAVLDRREQTVTASLDERPRQLDVPVVAGRPAELHEGRLDLRVPAHRLPSARPEHVDEVVGEADRHVDELPATGGAQPGDRSLQQVPHRVELVAPLHVRPPGPLPRPTEGGVQVAVRVLRRGHAVDEPVVAVGEVVVGLHAELPGHRLEQLVDLRVDELDPGVVERLPGCGGVEVARPADPLHPGLAVPDHGVGVPLLPVGPVAAGQAQVAERQGAERARGRHDRTGRDGGVGDGHDVLLGRYGCVSPSRRRR